MLIQILCPWFQKGPAKANVLIPLQSLSFRLERKVSRRHCTTVLELLQCDLEDIRTFFALIYLKNFAFIAVMNHIYQVTRIFPKACSIFRFDAVLNVKIGKRTLQLVPAWKLTKDFGPKNGRH